MHRSFLLTLLLCLAPAALASDTLQPELEGFRPFLGKTYRGELATSTPDKPQIDVSHWERALNGRAVRNLHSVNDGEYGGETLVVWDAASKSLRYWYFTTAGFRTEGTMTIDNGSYTAREAVSGNTDGITEVRSSSTLGADGSLQTRSEYLKNGSWVPGHGAHYVPVEGLEPKFR